MQFLSHMLATQRISSKLNHNKTARSLASIEKGELNQITMINDYKWGLNNGKKAILHNEPEKQFTNGTTPRPNPLKRTHTHSNTDGMGRTDQGASQNACQMRGGRAP